MGKLLIPLKFAGFAAIAALALLLAAISLPFSGWKALSVQTGSMRPNIDPGALVLVKGVPVNSLQAGDVITYLSPKDPKVTITHRVVQKLGLANGPKTFIVKGDANKGVDAPVPQKSVVGKVNAHLPYVGYAIDFVKKPLGLLLIIYIPSLIIIAREVQRLKRYYQLSGSYVSPLIRMRLRKAHNGPKYAMAAKSSMLALVIVGFVLVPVVYAAMSSQATLTDNTISSGVVVPPVEGPHVTLRKIVMRCSANNTVSKNVRPIIVIQNWTHQNFTANGWRVEDNSGTIINIPDGFEFKKLRQYRFTPYLANGLQYAGDRLVIKNGQGQVVDTLSWGTDTTAFTPSIANVTSGDRLERRPFHVDTDVAADWRVNDHRCWCPDQPDVEDGSDTGELGDTNESNRAANPGEFNLLEL